jgi:hypothetical protein
MTLTIKVTRQREVRAVMNDEKFRILAEAF